MSDNLVIIEEEGPLSIVRINNEKKMNSIPTKVLSELRCYFEELRFNKKTRVVILTGSEKAFSSGLDLREAGVSVLKAKKAGLNMGDAAYNGQLMWSDVVRAMRMCPQPIICCVSGWAMGGGFALAIASDIRLITKSAKMNVQMIRIGLSGCDIGISYFLPRIVGYSVAAEMMYTGNVIDADRAVQVGLASTAHDSLVDAENAARKLASDMLKTNPLALRLTKEGLKLNIDAPSLDSALAIEDRQQALLTSTATFGGVISKGKAKL